jgi:hypothetical protein
VKFGWLGTRAEKAGVAMEPLAPIFHKGELPWFATFRTVGGLELPEEARGQVLKRCLQEHGSRYALFAVVVMADHVHLVLQALHAERGWPFDARAILVGLKEGSGLKVRKVVGGAGPVWQEETFTVELRSQEILDDKCAFIRQNPVRTHVVTIPEDYAWLWVSTRV